MEYQDCLKQMKQISPRVHCLTNMVTMTDVANILLAAGGSAIMGQHPDEAAEITASCRATLLNIGTPDEDKFEACIEAGKQANELRHPVTFDPVGLGVSAFRRKYVERLLRKVEVDIIRCNPAEAYALMGTSTEQSGVESGSDPSNEERIEIAKTLAKQYRCSVLLSGRVDTVSDGWRTVQYGGGDDRIAQLTGGGCMLSALCALFSGAGMDSWDAACTASRLWKTSAYYAGSKIDGQHAGMGSFHMYLIDGVSLAEGDEEGCTLVE